jgi:Mor family transcriptional regulator
VRPDLKGKSDWDLVCHDTETGEGIAIEVKGLTEERLQERSKIMWQLLEEIKNSLSKSQKLAGTFHLYADIPGDYYLPVGQGDKKEMRNLFFEIICRAAPKLQIGEEADLKRRISLMLRIMKKTGRQFYIPQTLSCTLVKIDNEGSLLVLGSGLTYWKSPLEGAELQKFEELVSQAKGQLQKADVKETFLVFTEGHSGREGSELEKAFNIIKKESYSGIKYVYFVMMGEKVTEIPLPVA